MKPIIRLTFSVLLGIFVSYLSLFSIGSLSMIKAYEHPLSIPLSIPQIKLLFLQMFIYITMSGSISYLLLQSFKFKVRKMLLIIASVAMGIILTWFTLFFDAGYRPIGNYLRDYHGINWFFMDWGGYIITVVIYLIPVYSVLILILLEKVILKQSGIKKK